MFDYSLYIVSLSSSIRVVFCSKGKLNSISYHEDFPSYVTYPREILSKEIFFLCRSNFYYRLVPKISKTKKGLQNTQIRTLVGFSILSMSRFHKLNIHRNIINDVC